MFYAYHSTDIDLVCDNDRILLMGADRLSEMILEAGMLDWLIERAG